MRMDRKVENVVRNGFRVGKYKISFRFIPIVLGILFVMVLGIVSFAQDKDEAAGDGLNLNEVKGGATASTLSSLERVKSSLQQTASSSEKATDRSASQANTASQTDSGRMKAVAAKSAEAKNDENDQENNESKTAVESADTTADNSESASDNSGDINNEVIDSSEESGDRASESEAYDNSASYEYEGTYTVGEDDTLWDIAVAFGLDVDELLALNPDIDPETIQSGDVIHLEAWEGSASASEDEIAAVEETYTEDRNEDKTDEYNEGTSEYIETSGDTEEKETYDAPQNDEESAGREETTIANSQPEYIEPEETEYSLPEEEKEASAKEEAPEETVSEYEGEDVSGEETEASEADNENDEDSGDAETTDNTDTASSGYGQAIVDAAYAQIGVHQTCTQLVTNSLKAVGIDFAGSPMDYASLGEWTDNPVPGDICIYSSHVAIYIGDGMAIHGGWDGPGYTQSTQVWTVYVSWPPFIGYIHLPGN